MIYEGLVLAGFLSVCMGAEAGWGREGKAGVMGQLGSQREWVWEVDVPPPAKNA